MNNCSYCSELAQNKCSTCKKSMCSNHISDHVKDFNIKHKIVPHIYAVDTSKYQKKIIKRILILLKLKNEVLMQRKSFMNEIDSLCSAVIKKIDSKFNEIIKLSQIKRELNYDEYQNFISFFEFRITPDLVKIDEPKKYFCQDFFKETSKKNLSFHMNLSI